MRLSKKIKGVLATAAATSVAASTGACAAGDLNPAISKATTVLGINMLHKLAAATPNSNVFISPASIAICLDMCYTGAQAETAAAMAKTLGIQGLKMEDVNASNKALLNLLTSSDPQVQIMVSNALFAKKDVNFKQDFLQRCKNYYKASVSALDFSKSDTLGKINGWVNTNTKGMIPSIIDNIDPMAVMFLINTVYFKGEWTNPYEHDRTRPDDFHLLSGKTVKVPKMHGEALYHFYLETPKFQMVRLPYGQGRFGMYILLPKANVDYKQFVAAMKASDWDAWCQQLKEAKGVVHMPKYKINFKQVLNEVLTQLGMGIAFDRVKANFTGISDGRTSGNIYISDVIHAATMKVDEQGTEAAAATAIGMCGAGAPDPNAPRPFVMDVERPFVVGLADDKSGELLFIGCVVNP